MSLITFTAGTKAKSAEVDANFALCVLTDTAKTITVAHTWSASQIMAGLSSSAPITVSDTTDSTTSTTGSVTTLGGLGVAKSVFVGAAIAFATIVKSTTALATPSALAATQYSAFASTVSGAAIMGFGTTNDVALMNRAGTVVLGVGPNTTAVNIPGSLVLTGATITGLTAASVATGTFPGVYTITGALTLSSTLTGGATSDIAINTNKFTVAASTGNTVIAGTLGASGLITASVGIQITGNTTTAPGQLRASGSDGLQISGIVGSVNDFTIYNPTFGGAAIMAVATGTRNVTFGGKISTTTNVAPASPGDWGFASTTFGTYIYTKTGSVQDLTILAPDGNPLIIVPTGTKTVVIGGSVNTLSGTTTVNTGAGAVTLFTVPGPGYYLIIAYNTANNLHSTGIGFADGTAFRVVGNIDQSANFSLGISGYSFTITNNTGSNIATTWSYLRMN